MSAILDNGLDHERMADCERTDRAMNQHVQPTLAQVLNRFATYGAVHGQPSAMFSPADVHSALLKLESGLADWICSHDNDLSLEMAVSKVLEQAITEVSELIDGSAE